MQKSRYFTKKRACFGIPLEKSDQGILLFLLSLDLCWVRLAVRRERRQRNDVSVLPRAEVGTTVLYKGPRQGGCSVCTGTGRAVCPQPLPSSGWGLAHPCPLHRGRVGGAASARTIPWPGVPSPSRAIVSLLTLQGPVQNATSFRKPTLKPPAC